VPVAKRSEGKRSIGGRKHAVRRHDAQGTATAEVVTSGSVSPRPGDRNLLVPLMREGKIGSELSPAEALTQARSFHQRVRETLPQEAWALSRGEPALETVTD
jgi:nicotinate phosphoribosyltransferase